MVILTGMFVLQVHAYRRYPWLDLSPPKPHGQDLSRSGVWMIPDANAQPGRWVARARAYSGGFSNGMVTQNHAQTRQGWSLAWCWEAHGNTRPSSITQAGRAVTADPIENVSIVLRKAESAEDRILDGGRASPRLLCLSSSKKSPANCGMFPKRNRGFQLGGGIEFEGRF